MRKTGVKSGPVDNVVALDFLCFQPASLARIDQGRFYTGPRSRNPTQNA